MCHGQEKYHVQCGHVHSFLIEVPCERARAADARSMLLHHMYAFPPPPLCVNCYRSEEIKSATTLMRSTMRSGKERENDRRALEDPNLTPGERSRLRAAQIEEGTCLLNENRKERAVALKAFRDSQGFGGMVSWFLFIAMQCFSKQLIWCSDDRMKAGIFF